MPILPATPPTRSSRARYSSLAETDDFFFLQPAVIQRDTPPPMARWRRGLHVNRCEGAADRPVRRILLSENADLSPRPRGTGPLGCPSPPAIIQLLAVGEDGADSLAGVP